MIKSMTGYGRSEFTIGNTKGTIEIRCVNGRFLDFSTRISKEWSDKEMQIRDLVRGRIDRGSVNVNIRSEDLGGEGSVHIDVSLARGYALALQQLKRELNLTGDVSLDHITSFPQIFEGTQVSDQQAEVWPTIAAAITAALDALDEMRIREGSEISNDLIARLDVITNTLADVQQLSADRIPLERERLRERVAQVVDDKGIDEQRLHLEIVLLADKLDISEECVRLRSHLKHFREDMNTGAAVGRKLNFQLQEMNREVNTIGSKSNDAAIARMVVSMKEELERIREQVQNIE